MDGQTTPCDHIISTTMSERYEMKFHVAQLLYEPPHIGIYTDKYCYVNEGMAYICVHCAASEIDDRSTDGPNCRSWQSSYVYGAIDVFRHHQL